MNTASLLDAQLPWSAHPADTRRFRRILGAAVFFMATLSLIVSQVKLPVVERSFIENIPLQSQKIKLVEQKKSVLLQTKPAVKPKAAPSLTTKETSAPAASATKASQKSSSAPTQTSHPSSVDQAKTKAQGQINTFSNLLSQISDLPQAPAQVNILHSNQPEQNASPPNPNNDRINNRAYLSQAAGKGLASVNSTGQAELKKQALSDSGMAQSSQQQLSQRQHAQQIDMKTLPSKKSTAQRSRESIQTVFDKNKSAIYAIYNRTLRSKPDLQGKIVFFLQIDGQGRVTECRIVSSELNDAELSQKLIARIKLFNFGTIEDVQPWRDTFFLDFIPS